MGAILDSLAADAVNAFLADFGETIAYTPAGGSPLSIQAVITRKAAGGAQGFSGSAIYVHEISVANDSTAGVTSVGMGRDVVSFAGRVGGTTENFIVMVILANDQGMWTLGVG